MTGHASTPFESAVGFMARKLGSTACQVSISVRQMLTLSRLVLVLSSVAITVPYHRFIV